MKEFSKKNDAYPLVSISIITYNQIEFIEEALSSALEQDYSNLEVVVADDGSTDGTAEIILEFAQRYPDRLVPIVGGKNLGITGNSNRALRACKGKYIAFQGGDDVLLPSKIIAQVQWFEEDPNRVLCGHQVEVFYEDSSKTHNIQHFLPKGIGPSSLIRNGHPFGATSIMVAAKNIPNDGFNQKLPSVSDGLFWIECLINGGEYGYVDGIYARYRKHSSNFTNQKLKATLELEQLFSEISKKYPDYTKDCRIGLANQFEYGLGIAYALEGNKKNAFKHFFRSIKINPFNYKTYIRCIFLLVGR